MNAEHLRALVWLRWRLRVNQLKRGGIANAVVLILVAWTLVCASAGLALAGLLVGLLALRHAPPIAVLATWDGVVAGMLFFWMIGLLTELQRTDALSLDRLMHLPVSPAGAFLVNYLSSLASVTLALFLPGMVTLVLGLTLSRGPAMLLALPLLAAFVFALTALTYQFQGWLAALMSNPRRRRTIVVLLTLGFILVFQLPNLINVLRPWEGAEKAASELAQRQEELRKEREAGRITPQEYQKAVADAQREQSERAAAEARKTTEQAKETAEVLNLALPPGWLPAGVAGLAEGHVLTALLGTAGFALIGSLSLWRAYRTTLRIYTGQVSGGGGTRKAGPAVPDSRPRMIEWRLPGVPEPAAAVALAGLRSFLRAPEAKMALIAPIIMVLIFGSMLVSGAVKLPAEVRPFVAVGASATALFVAIQLVGNQFGFDRSGFRSFVLAPIPRRDVLLGKNLAAAPLTLGVGGVLVLVAECVYPMRPDHLLAVLMQAVAMYLVFCLVANLMSILAPLPIAPGTMKASNAKVVPVLIQMGLFMFFPVLVAPTVAPLGVELLFAELGWVRGAPVALLLSVLVLAGVVVVYRQALTWEGALLAAREQRVLEAVTAKET